MTQLVFMFDGTGNGRDDTYPTNIRILNDAIDGGHYYEGPGNDEGWVSKAFGGGFGGGVLNTVGDAYTALKSRYKPGMKIYVSGFSRGAATARLFSAKVCKEGVNGHDTGIEFMGCFDTVFARIPVGWFQQNSLFGDLHVSPKVKRACHAVALDENRKPFIPSLMNAREGISEVWFRGCHSDIGGGYKNRGLADITLHWMVEQAVKSGLQIDVRKLPKIGASPIEDHLEGGFWGRRAARRVGVKRDDEWTDEEAVVWA